MQKRNNEALFGFRKLNRRVVNPKIFQGQKHVSSRESVWNHVYQKVMKITSQAKEKIDDTLQCGTHIDSDASSDENYG